MSIEERQYPIGKWQIRDEYAADEIEQSIQFLLAFPQEIEQLTATLSATDWAKPYREGGWNVRQLVHHLADTHLFYLIRLKHALTEDNPNGLVAKVNEWANYSDYGTDASVADSLGMLAITHRKFIFLVQSLNPEQWQRTYHHPVRQLNINVAQSIDMLLWHCKHHLAHIKLALAG